MGIIKIDEKIIYKGSLYKYLDDSASKYLHIQYITPDSTKTTSVIELPGLVNMELSDMTSDIKNSSTGLVFFVKENSIDVLIPAFSVIEDFVFGSYSDFYLKSIFEKPRLIGIILLRLGRFALAVLDKEQIIASKTEGRYVKNRHKAGGSSQRRFERSRERLVRELYDKSCEEMKNVFGEYIDRMDYIFLGGEKHTLNGFKKRCPFMDRHNHKIMNRILDIDIPNKKTLDIVYRQVYSSKLLTYKIIRN
tara:strand:- start:4594 stop:5340 length:747 start_codon:yes stop_codon:yes gene_type:complete